MHWGSRAGEERNQNMLPSVGCGSLRLLNDAISLDVWYELRTSLEAANYALSHFDKDRLQTIVSVPVGQHRDLRRIDFAVRLAHERQVHTRQELDAGWPLRVGISASDLKRVDSVLMHGLPSSYMSRVSSKQEL